MKKGLILSLTAALVFTLAGCGQSAEPAAATSASKAGSSETASAASGDGQTAGEGLLLYKQAVARLSEQVENGSFRCGYSVKNDSGAYDITTTGVMAVTHAGGFRLSNQTESEMGGDTLASNWYCDGREVYAESGGITRKQPLNDDALDRLTRLVRSYSSGLIDPADAAAESESTEQTDGDVSVALTMDAGTLESVAAKFSEVFGAQYQLVSLDYAAVIDTSGNLKTAQVDTEVATTAGGQIASFTMSMQLTFSELGAALDITPPAAIDLQQAQAVDSLWS